MGTRPRANGPRTQMTRTVTLVVMRHVATHDLSYDPMKEARRLKRGDIIDVMLTPPNATRVDNDWFWNEPIGNPRLGFVHMREVPEERWTHMRRRFTERLLDNNTGSAEQTDERDNARRRRWRFHIGDLATNQPPKHSQLMNNGETTLAWTVARDYIRKKVFTEMEDASKDNEASSVDDSDLPAA